VRGSTTATEPDGQPYYMRTADLSCRPPDRGVLTRGAHSLNHGCGLVLRRRDYVQPKHAPLTYAPELNPDEYLNCDLKASMHSAKPASNKSAAQEEGGFTHANVAEKAGACRKIF
jgi:hypothetical protein